MSKRKQPEIEAHTNVGSPSRIENKTPKLDYIVSSKDSKFKFSTSHKILKAYNLECGDYVRVYRNIKVTNDVDENGWVIGYDEVRYLIGFRMESGKEVVFELGANSRIDPGEGSKNHMKSLLTVLHRREIILDVEKVKESYSNLSLLEPEKTYGSDIVLKLPNSAKFPSIPDQFYTGKRYELNLHKNILASCSKVFLCNFFGGFDSPKSMEMTILNEVKNDSGDEITSFWTFIRFLYGERRKDLSLTNLVYMHYFASYLEATDKQFIEDEIQLKKMGTFGTSGNTLEEVSTFFPFAEVLGMDSYIGKLTLDLLFINVKTWKTENDQIANLIDILKLFPNLMNATLAKSFALHKN